MTRARTRTTFGRACAACTSHAFQIQWHCHNIVHDMYMYRYMYMYISTKYVHADVSYGPDSRAATGPRGRAALLA